MDDRVALRLSAGMAAHQQGRLDEAVARYRDVLALDPDHVAARHLLGVIMRQQGDAAGAVGWLEQAARLRPDVAAISASLAETYLALNRADEAADAAQRALDQGPDDPVVRCVLGLAHKARGRLEEGVDQIRRALALRPDDGVAHGHLGDLLRLLGRYDEARAACLEAIRLDPSLALPHAHLGLLAVRDQQIDQAGRFLTRAVELDASRPDLWEALARFYGWIQQYHLAIPCWERALRGAPQARVEPRLAYAWALQEEHRLDEAEARIREALALDPNSVPAHVDLGGLHEERGDFAEAEAEFRHAIALQPTFAPAHSRLSRLLGHKLPDRDFQAIRALLDDPETDSDGRTRLLYAEGAQLDFRGDYDGAAASLRAANARALLAASGPLRYDATKQSWFFEDLTRAFTAAFFRRMAGAGHETRCPVFIVGLPRSGTTLIEQVLASHPQVHGAGELALGRLMYGNLPSLLKIGEPSAACVGYLTPDFIRGLADAYLERLATIARRPADRIVDKMPHNFLYLGLLATLFPNATIIHCRRDLRDVALSCWMTDFRSIAWATDPGHMGQEFRGYLSVMNHWRATLPLPIHEVNYEEAVADLEPVARRLIAAMGLDWDPACLEFHRSRRTIRTASVTQARQPVYTRSVGRWKNYQHNLADLFAALPIDHSDPARRAS